MSLRMECESKSAGPVPAEHTVVGRKEWNWGLRLLGLQENRTCNFIV